MSVYYLPWWGLVVCLAASALAAYFFLERSRAGDSPWVLLPLTVILAPMLLAVAMVVAITLSMLLSHAVVEDWRGTPPEKSEPPAAPSEHTRSRASPTTTVVDGRHPATTEGPPTTTSTATATATASP
jgi:hypothetical protein